MSLLSKTTMSFVAARKPALEPPPNPRFLSSASTRMDGKRSATMLALPSVDPLSTTMISLSGWPLSASMIEGRYRSSRSRPFQLGITTEAELFEQGTSEGKRFLFRKLVSRSVALTAMIAASIRKGESSNSGRNLISRQRMVRSVLTDSGRARTFGPASPSATGG